MTQTTDTAASGAAAEDAGTTGSASRGKQVGLNKMLLSDLKTLAGNLGIKGTTGMRKSALVDAITSAQASDQASGQRSAPRASGWRSSSMTT